MLTLHLNGGFPSLLRRNKLTLAFLSDALFPQEDMIDGYSHQAHMLVGFSIGYFMYDFLDMALYNPKRSTYELLFHHACVVTCFGIAASSNKFLPYACLSLMIEINSIFLHLRQLFVIKVRNTIICYFGALLRKHARLAQSSVHMCGGRRKSKSLHGLFFDVPLFIFISSKY